MDLASKLYEMIEDMDHMDYAETKEEDLQDIRATLDSIKDTSLYKLLEIITE